LTNDKNVLEGLLDEKAAQKTVDQLGDGIVTVLGDVLEKVDEVVTNTLDDISRGLAEDEAEFQRRRREKESNE
jgi:hypothetical protein